MIDNLSSKIDQSGYDRWDGHTCGLILNYKYYIL